MAGSARTGPSLGLVAKMDSRRRRGARMVRYLWLVTGMGRYCIFERTHRLPRTVTSSVRRIFPAGRRASPGTCFRMRRFKPCSCFRPPHRAKPGMNTWRHSSAPFLSMGRHRAWTVRDFLACRGSLPSRSTTRCKRWSRPFANDALFYRWSAEAVRLY
jgi:hypothetical protein